MRHSVPRLVLALFLLASLGTIAELLLLGHFEEFTQWVPVVLLGLGALLGAGLWVRPGPELRQTFVAVMALDVLAAGVGVVLHARMNVAFEREMYPTLSGLPLVWETLTGATPALAPGTMAVLGGLGLIYVSATRPDGV